MKKIITVVALLLCSLSLIACHKDNKSNQIEETIIIEKETEFYPESNPAKEETNETKPIDEMTETERSKRAEEPATESIYYQDEYGKYYTPTGVYNDFYNVPIADRNESIYAIPFSGRTVSYYFHFPAVLGGRFDKEFFDYRGYGECVVKQDSDFRVYHGGWVPEAEELFGNYLSQICNVQDVYAAMETQLVYVAQVDSLVLEHTELVCINGWEISRNWSRDNLGTQHIIDIILYDDYPCFVGAAGSDLYQDFTTLEEAMDIAMEGYRIIIYD